MKRKKMSRKRKRRKDITLTLIQKQENGGSEEYDLVIGMEEVEKVEEEKEEKQSQKRYMVSGSLCPLISFLDVSYSVSFVIRGPHHREVFSVFLVFV